MQLVISETYQKESNSNYLGFSSNKPNKLGYFDSKDASLRFIHLSMYFC